MALVVGISGNSWYLVLFATAGGASDNDVTSSGASAETDLFFDVNCKPVGMDELAKMNPEIKRVLDQAAVAVAANIVAIVAVLANMDKIKKEISEGDPMKKMAGMASLAQATAFQARVLADNKRIQDRIKECKGVLKGFGFDQ